MKLKLTIALCVLALVLMTGCSDDDNGVETETSLVGTWNLSAISEDGVPQDLPEWTVIFNADGSGTWTEEGVSESITWSVSGTQLTVSWEGDPISGPYTLSDNTLTYTVTEGGIITALTWTKQGT